MSKKKSNMEGGEHVVPKKTKRRSTITKKSKVIGTLTRKIKIRIRRK